MLRNSGVTVVQALGNSMGASGAVLACHLFPDISRTFAFVPQANPYADRRWMKYTSEIETIRWQNFAALPCANMPSLFFGDTGPDELHVNLFREAGHDVRIFENCGHKLAEQLKERGEYEALLNEFW